ncbi:MAG: FAD binding domain-containing protein [Acidimicrobiia bacterium]
MIGAGVTHTKLCEAPVADRAPALAVAARTVGSPQIRNAGTIGGNLGTASPAGDTLPVLHALDAAVELTGPAGVRTVPVREFVTGVKRTALAAGELDHRRAQAVRARPAGLPEGRCAQRDGDRGHVGRLRRRSDRREGRRRPRRRRARAARRA